MRRIFFWLTAVLAYVPTMCGAEFDTTFNDSTLRIDIRVVDGGDETGIHLEDARKWSGWYGRRHNLRRPQYPSSITVAVVGDDGDTLYCDSKYLTPSMYEYPSRPAYATLMMPIPRADATINVSTWHDEDMTTRPWQNLSLRLSQISARTVEARTPYVTLRRAADPEHALYLAIVGDGYTAGQMPEFARDAASLDSALFSHKAFADRADRINVIAVMLESAESGVSRPSRGQVVNSALGSHFDSFNLDRLITIPDTRPMWDALQGLPACQVFVLANTEDYGGSGPYNEYAIASAHNPWREYIIIHEFGHSLANLGDEYEDGYDISYYPDVEPDEPNITTLYDFSQKWYDMVLSGEATLIEGAGYQSHGIYRGTEHCLMRQLSDLRFCPVCTRAIIRTIDYYTGH